MIQYSGKMCDGYPVIGHRYLLLLCPVDAVHHIFPVKHTCSALDDQIISGKVIRKIGSAYQLYLQVFSKSYLQHPGNFHSANILFQRCMCAAFGNQYMRSFFQTVNCFCSLYVVRKISLVCRKQYRNGSKHALFWIVLIDEWEHLRICAAQLRWSGKSLQCSRIPGSSHTHYETSFIQQFS